MLQSSRPPFRAAVVTLVVRDAMLRLDLGALRDDILRPVAGSPDFGRRSRNPGLCRGRMFGYHRIE
jgi:hypothetical protein